MVGFETVCIPSGQANPCSPLQGEVVWNPPLSGSPILAIPDVVLGTEQRLAWRVWYIVPIASSMAHSLYKSD